MLTRARPLLLAVAALLVAAACTDDGSDGAAENPPIATLPDDPGAGPADPGDPGGAPGTSPGTPGNRQTPGRSSTTQRNGDAPATTQRTTTTADRGAAIAAAARSGPGGFARTLLRPQASTRVVVEVLVEPGAAPRQGTLDHVGAVLRDATRKAVTLSGPVSLPQGDGTVTADEIRALADRYGRARQGGDGQAVVRLLFLRGGFEPEDSVLGIAVRGDTAAVFVDNVQQASTPLVPAALLEDAVTTHEIGHLLGLVDLALDTGRDDDAHPGHSRNRDSVMYWAVESDVVSQALDGPPSRSFDQADRDDLAALRNGA